MSTPGRRGICPSLANPLATGDGLLVRLMLPRTTLEAFSGLCAAARHHGNGLIEITSRGSVQVRGLRPESHEAFARAVLALGIEPGEGVAVTISPLTGLNPGEGIDVTALAHALRRVLARSPFAARLGPKTSVALDGGGRLHLDALAADIRLRYVPDPRPCFHIALGGDGASARALGSVTVAHGVEAVMRLLGVIAARGPFARARDIIRTEGLSPFRDAAGDFLADAPAPPTREPADPLGIHGLHDARIALGVGLPFGHAHAVELKTLIDQMRQGGVDGVRFAPGRALLFVGLAPDAAATMKAAAENLGFIVEARDPRRSIVVCAGAPACASAELSTRALAPLLAAAAHQLFDGTLTLHVSGCAKGCAHGASALLTIVGTNNRAGLVLDGPAHGRPRAVFETAVLPAAFEKLAAAVEAARRPGEPSADVLARFGALRVLSVLESARG